MDRDQDRLVKELRLAGVCTIEEGNAVISGGWLDEINTRFSRPPADERDFHRALQRDEDLGCIFAVRARRTVASDFTVRFENRVLQITRQPGLPRPRQRVTVATLLDGTLRVEFGGCGLDFEDVTRTHRQSDPTPVRKQERRSTAHKPAADHPWNRTWRECRSTPMAASAVEHH